MKIVSFNVCMNNNINGRTIAERAVDLKTILDRYDPDVIGIQEARPYWLEAFDQLFSEYAYVNRWRKTTNEEGTPILWKKDKFDLLDSGYFWFSDTPDEESGGWDDYAGCYRICMWVKLREKASGKEFYHYNTHYGFGATQQPKYAPLIFSKMDAAGAKTAFLTADFNLNEKSPCYAQLAERLLDCNKATTNVKGRTYQGLDPTVSEEGLAIDFIFVTPETIKPLDFKRITDNIDGVVPSDHFGIYAEVELL